MTENIWPVFHAECRALGADLQCLRPEQWRTPSLCEGWDVEQALAHLVGTAKLTPVVFVAKLAGAGFRPKVAADRGIEAERRGGTVSLLASLGELERSTKAPLGPKLSWLMELVVHAEDIRRPLGIRHSYPLDTVSTLLDYSAGSALLGGKRRVAGLTLKASDSDWSRGSGPLVEGPALSLLLATTGRTAALDDLSGPGVELLAAR